MKSENDLIREKFKKTGYATPTELARGLPSVLSEETYTAVIHRNTRPSLKTLLIMMIELNFTTQEISDVLTARGGGELVIGKLIDPYSITVQEKELVESYRALGGDPTKERLVSELIANLAK